ncbi:MAG: exosortase A [Cellvibrionaceae bacterium]
MSKDKSIEITQGDMKLKLASLSIDVWTISLAFLSIYLLTILAIYHQSFLSMVDIWQRSDTFAHGFFIPVISLWLVWRERRSVSSLRPEITPKWLLLVFGSSGIWLLGALANALVIEQLGVVLMLIFGVVFIVGDQVGRRIAFPLLFLILMVPMGDELIEPMMEITATSTVWLVRLVGIPVFREGLYFSLPSGNWSVVEACSGVRYLIASFALGTLYAYLTYKSFYKRSFFVILSIVVPVIANSLRAFMIVMIGHYSDMKHAVGVDHLIYGWAFFGIVIFIMFWIGNFFSDDMNVGGARDERRPEGYATLFEVPLSVVALPTMLLVLIVVVNRAPDWLLPKGLDASQFRLEYVPVESLPAIRNHRVSDWSPNPVGPDFSETSHFLFNQKPVTLYQYHYLKRRDGGELVNSLDRWHGNSEGAWRLVRKGSKNLVLGGESRSIEYAILSNGKVSQLIYRWYHIDTYIGSDPYITKIRQTLAIFDPTVKVLGRYYLATPFQSSVDNAQSRLSEFLIQLPSQDAVLQREEL